MPTFAHVPMILGADGKKLSKRHGATAVGDYRNLGILPLAMRNFLALLGWSPGGDREILPEAEMIRLFSLEGIQKKPAVFDLTKLEWMNGEYLSLVPVEDLLGPVKHHLEEIGVQGDGQRLPALIDAVKARSRTLLDIAKQVAVRVDASQIKWDGKASDLQKKLGPRWPSNLLASADRLESLPDWTQGAIHDALKSFAEEGNQKLGDVMQPIRAAVTGSTVSEPVDLLLTVVGKKETIARIRDAAERPS
jgi:glutamyl-tRNA synthetase